MEHIQRLEGNVQLAQMRHDAIGSDVTAAVLKQAKEALEAAKADPKKSEPKAAPKKEPKAPEKKQTEPTKPEEKGEADADQKAEGADADEKPAEDAKKNETE